MPAKYLTKFINKSVTLEQSIRKALGPSAFSKKGKYILNDNIVDGWNSWHVQYCVYSLNTQHAIFCSMSSYPFKYGILLRLMVHNYASTTELPQFSWQGSVHNKLLKLESIWGDWGGHQCIFKIFVWMEEMWNGSWKLLPEVENLLA